MVGNLSNYHKIDIIRTFFCLRETKSRVQLVKELNIGEGTIRTLLNILKKKELIDSTREGHKLSEKGLKILYDFQQRFNVPRLIRLDAFYPKMKKVAILVKNSPEVSYVKLRDIALKNGAEGAMIFRYTNKLELPGHKGRFLTLEKEFNFSEGDLLVVGFALNKRWAEIGSLAIVSQIVNKLKSFISDF